MIIRNEGNLFDNFHQAYAHGVSNLGIMGRGIALEFKERYPEMFEEYRVRCNNGILKPGECFFYHGDIIDLPSVFNLVTQDNIFQAQQEFLEKGIKEMYMTACEKGITDIAMPEIGCGLGNLHINDLIESLSPFIEDSRHHITIYSLMRPKN